MHGIAMAVALSAAAGVAGAQTIGDLFVEVESNDTLATANFIGTFEADGGALAIAGFKGIGDVDSFEFALAQNATLVLAQAGAVPISSDTQLQLVDSAGTIIEFDDDDGPGLLSAIVIENLAAGNYFIGISSFPDGGSTSLFDGLDDAGAPLDDEFSYKIGLAANVVPAPGALVLVGLGGIVAGRRRR